jgi:hypothetical protein
MMGQHIVEVMGDAAGQLPDSLHLLALRQLHFQRLALGFVDGEDREVLSHALQPGKGELNQAGLLVHDGGINHNHRLILVLKLVEPVAKLVRSLSTTMEAKRQRWLGRWERKPGWLTG